MLESISERAVPAEPRTRPPPNRPVYSRSSQPISEPSPLHREAPPPRRAVLCRPREILPPPCCTIGNSANADGPPPVATGADRPMHTTPDPSLSRAGSCLSSFSRTIQKLPQFHPRIRNVRPHRRFRTIQLGSNFVGRQPFHIAQQKRRPLPPGQRIQPRFQTCVIPPPT